MVLSTKASHLSPQIPRSFPAMALIQARLYLAKTHAASLRIGIRAALHHLSNEPRYCSHQERRVEAPHQSGQHQASNCTPTLECCTVTPTARAQSFRPFQLRRCLHRGGLAQSDTAISKRLRSLITRRRPDILQLVLCARGLVS